MKKLAFIFPGQGSQEINMGKDFYDNFPIYREVFEHANDILKYAIDKIIFNGQEEELSKTKNSQIAIFLNSIAILKVLNKNYPNIYPIITAGLSLGEYSALVASQKLDFEDAIILIQKRANFMDEACKSKNGSMAAVLGLKKEDLQKLILDFKDLWIANFNTDNQMVISGNKDSILEISKVLNKMNIKVVLLNVQGAFHTPYMKLAKDKLSKEILKVKINDSKIDIVMNVNAKITKDKDIIKDNLINQMTSSVRWEETIKTIDPIIDLFVEIGNGKTLTNMNKKLNVKADSISIQKVTDLKEFEKCI